MILEVDYVMFVLFSVFGVCFLSCVVLVVVSLCWWDFALFCAYCSVGFALFCGCGFASWEGGLGLLDGVWL